MGFNIAGKVAIITGGASGLGFEFAKKLLRNGLKAVTLADINEKVGENALEELTKEFGSDKAIFVNADVSNKNQFEDVFNKTIKTYKNVDILINNAGIFDDKNYEREIAVNLNATVHGTLLGLENYIPKYKSGEEGLIINIASVAGILVCPFMPLYAATKSAVLSMSRSFGDIKHYEGTKVKLITICPGLTKTQILVNPMEKSFGSAYAQMMEKVLNIMPIQEVEDVGNGLVDIIKKAEAGSVWTIEGGEEPYEVEIPQRIGTRKRSQD